MRSIPRAGVVRWCAVALALAAGAAAAQVRTPDGRHAPDRHRATGAPRLVHLQDLRLDQRYQHNHYYPPRGRTVPVLPGGSVGISFGSGNLFFHGGVWFRPSGSRFVIIAPPVGVVVPLLPPSYVTLWIGGVPYYYANGVYYAPDPGQGYVVVAPPPGAENLPPPVVPAPGVPPEPVIYPRSGQTPEQTESDRRECNRWATTQAGAMADASVFQRAVAACMDGRGYTVR